MVRSRKQFIIISVWEKETKAYNATLHQMTPFHCIQKIFDFTSMLAAFWHTVKAASILSDYSGTSRSEIPCNATKSLKWPASFDPIENSTQSNTLYKCISKQFTIQTSDLVQYQPILLYFSNMTFSITTDLSLQATASTFTMFLYK